MVFRRAKQPPPNPNPIDPAAVAPEYRATVADAVRALQQFDRLVAALQPGPRQERLRELRVRVDAGVVAVFETARKATQLADVVAALDPERVAGELKAARRAEAAPEIVDTLTARFGATQRLLNSLDELRGRLVILEARLATAVAGAADVALTAPADGFAAVEQNVESLVTELEALAQATAELG